MKKYLTLVLIIFSSVVFAQEKYWQQHEKYQEINGVRYHFDDKEILTEQLNLIS